MLVAQLPVPNFGFVNIVMTPVVVIRPMALSADVFTSVNHSAPSGPEVSAVAKPEGRGNVVVDPDVVMRPMAPPSSAMNHSAPSGPVTMPPFPHVPTLPRGAGKNVVVAEVVVRPMSPAE